MHKLGDGRITEVRIWQVGAWGRMSNEEWDAFSEESEWCQPLKSDFLLNGGLADPIQWFPTSANMEWWIEEVDIVEEEFCRLVMSCDTVSRTWISLAAASTKVGYTTYARQKVDMLMAEDAWNWFKTAKGTWPSDGITVAEHAWTNRPPVHIDWWHVPYCTWS